MPEKQDLHTENVTDPNEVPLKEQEEARTQETKGDTAGAIQNERLQAPEHTPIPSILSNLQPLVAATTEKPVLDSFEKPEYGKLSDLVEALATHTLKTTHDVILHEALEKHLEAMHGEEK